MFEDRGELILQPVISASDKPSLASAATYSTSSRARRMRWNPDPIDSCQFAISYAECSRTVAVSLWGRRQSISVRQHELGT